jgi:predicted Zn-dependent protease
VRDPALNAYVRSVLCKVTDDYCRDVRVYIVDVPYFNASMAPNGAMMVWTGTLLRVRNEAQLALVLGPRVRPLPRAPHAAAVAQAQAQLGLPGRVRRARLRRRRRHRRHGRRTSPAWRR